MNKILNFIKNPIFIISSIIIIIIIIIIIVSIPSKDSPYNCKKGQQKYKECGNICGPICNNGKQIDSICKNCKCPDGQVWCGDQCCNKDTCKTVNDSQICCSDDRLCTNNNDQFCCPDATICGDKNTCLVKCGSKICDSDSECFEGKNLSQSSAQYWNTKFPDDTIDISSNNPPYTGYTCVDKNSCTVNINSNSSQFPSTKKIVNSNDFDPFIKLKDQQSDLNKIGFCSSLNSDNAKQCYDDNNTIDKCKTDTNCKWNYLLTDTSENLNSLYEATGNYGYCCANSTDNDFMQMLTYDMEINNNCPSDPRSCIKLANNIPNVIDIVYDDTNNKCKLLIQPSKINECTNKPPILKSPYSCSSSDGKIIYTEPSVTKWSSNGLTGTSFDCIQKNNSIMYNTYEDCIDTTCQKDDTNCCMDGWDYKAGGRCIAGKGNSICSVMGKQLTINRCVNAMSCTDIPTNTSCGKAYTSMCNPGKGGVNNQCGHTQEVYCKSSNKSNPASGGEPPENSIFNYCVCDTKNWVPYETAETQTITVGTDKNCITLGCSTENKDGCNSEATINTLMGCSKSEDFTKCPSPFKS